MNNNEAPMSVNVTAYYKGFSMQVTQRSRDVDVKPLVTEQMELINWLIEQGCKPSWNDETNNKHGGSTSQQTTPPAEVKNVTCEVCGEAATERKGTTKAGKQYHGIFCSTDNKAHTRWLWN